MSESQIKFPELESKLDVHSSINHVISELDDELIQIKHFCLRNNCSQTCSLYQHIQFNVFQFYYESSPLRYPAPLSMC